MISRFYPIVDAGVLARRRVGVADFARELRAAGVTLVQYRDKDGSPQDVLRAAAVIREAFAGADCRLILNDRADLTVLAGWDGVHVGQDDLSPADARRVVGASRWVGTSTHSDEQVRVADAGCADYVAVGPVFATGTKLDAEPVIGLDGVRRARALTAKPIVAIGGITRANAAGVIAAGADSVAVISGLFVEGETVQKVAEDFLRIFG
ncbi:thiamine-phosphate synthase [Edaphobacter acidisoli]|uniref:Thiamine-phosphate synthase n=1 Tax=Edaphobacter acidisoli TaxID=2040573 RepID=A0A916RI37_9BACT|nr:thiamine phosphate synthase [Edaphobacter acidisoli]GGA58321.1 thiamine-phosphate synthase [Edaphobacter acidisoli]